MITPQELEQVTAVVREQGLSEQLITHLRESFPGRHFTYCFDDDISAGKPVSEGDGFAIYLVDSSEHCSVLTRDLDTASGFVLAETMGD